jgi:hypothetical protein
LEFYLLYLYIIFRIVPLALWNVPRLPRGNQIVPRGTIWFFTGWNIIAIPFVIVGIIQSIIGITQVFIQHSIGLSLLRESLVSPSIPGVAKLVFHGKHYIRAYGLFPHPNILGGYLIFSIILTLLYIRMFHVEHNTPSPYQGEGAPLRRSFSEASRRADEVNDVPPVSPAGGRVTTWVKVIYFSLIVQSMCLFLTFSKSAILGLAIALLYLYVPRLTRGNQIVPRGTIWFFTGWNKSRTKIIVLAFLCIIAFIYIANQDLRANLVQSYAERGVYLNVSRGTISANPIIGVGIGQFVWNMQRYSPVPLETWQFQPVHNVFLLIWSELGLIGLILFIYWLYTMFHVEHYTPLSFIRRGVGGEVKDVPPASPAGGRGTIEDTRQGSSTKDLNTISNNNIIFLSSSNTLSYFKAVLLGFLFIMLFDHYFWDIQQGSLMLWMTLGFIAGMSNQKNNN